MARIHTTFGNEIHKKQVEVIDLPLMPNGCEISDRMSSIIRATAIPEIAYWVHSEAMQSSQGKLYHRANCDKQAFSFVCKCCYWSKKHESQTSEQQWHTDLRNLVFHERVLFLCHTNGIKHLIFRKGLGFGDSDLSPRDKVVGHECARFPQWADNLLEEVGRPKVQLGKLFKHFGVW